MKADKHVKRHPERIGGCESRFRTLAAGRRMSPSRTRPLAPPSCLQASHRPDHLHLNLIGFSTQGANGLTKPDQSDQQLASGLMKASCLMKDAVSRETSTRITTRPHAERCKESGTSLRRLSRGEDSLWHVPLEISHANSAQADTMLLAEYRPPAANATARKNDPSSATKSASCLSEAVFSSR